MRLMPHNDANHVDAVSEWERNGEEKHKDKEGEFMREHDIKMIIY